MCVLWVGGWVGGWVWVCVGARAHVFSLTDSVSARACAKLPGALTDQVVGESAPGNLALTRELKL